MRNKYLYFILFLFCFSACKDSAEQAPAPKSVISSNHLLLGHPSNAFNDPNNYLLQKPQYTLSYSRDRGTPNWVSWHVSKDWLGSAPRQDDFRTDNTLPAGWYPRLTPAAALTGGTIVHLLTALHQQKIIRLRS
jgi:endonuclease G, mitochondrial